jgi:hypothetical protein
MMQAGSRRQAIPTQFMPRGIVPEKMAVRSDAIFGIFCKRWNPLKR